MSEAAAIDIRSVLIPLSEIQLLLPNVVVAEVLGYQDPAPREGAPDWYLGDLSWRGGSIPMVSIERLMGDPMLTPQRRGRTIVTNTLNGEKALPHIAIVAQSIPSLVRVSEDNVEPVAEDEPPYLVSKVVGINNITVMIPDLDELERRVFEIVGR
jgi:chemosensory pili system protein ChpC